MKTTRIKRSVNGDKTTRHVRIENSVYSYAETNYGMQLVSERTFQTNAAARRFLRDN